MHYSAPIWSLTEDLNRGPWYSAKIAILIINDATWVIHSKFCFTLNHLGFQGKNAGVLGSVNKSHQLSLLGFLGGTSGKEPTCQRRRRKSSGFSPWVRKIPWRRAWQPTPVFLPGESHGQRSLWTTVHRVTKSQTRLKQLSIAQHLFTNILYNYNIFLYICSFIQRE